MCACNNRDIFIYRLYINIFACTCLCLNLPINDIRLHLKQNNNVTCSTEIFFFIYWGKYMTVWTINHYSARSMHSNVKTDIAMKS